MRVSLLSDPAEFVKQVADLRRFLHREDAKGGKAAVNARFLTASYVPFLATLRTELRPMLTDETFKPQDVLDGVAVLMGNLAMTLVQSMVDAPPEVQAEMIDRLLVGAQETAAMMIENDARMKRDAAARAKPNLAILNGGKQ